MKEEWKDIKGYEGLYRVSNFGKVESVEREVSQGKYGKKRIVGGSMMTPTDNGHGYLIVALSKNQRKKNHYVHRLVAEHFVENGDWLPCVNHKDYDTSNNRADNLEWCTQEQNIRYSAHRMRKPHKQWRRPSSGEKYIYLRYSGYRLSIRGKIDKVIPTLAEAKRVREVILSGEKYFAG